MSEKNIRKGRTGSPGIEVKIDYNEMEYFNQRYRHEKRLIKSSISEDDGKGYVFIGSVAVDNVTGEVCFIDCRPANDEKETYIGFNDSVCLWLGENDETFSYEKEIKRQMKEKIHIFKEAIAKPIICSEDYAIGGKCYHLVEKYSHNQGKVSNIHAMSKKEPRYIR